MARKLFDLGLYDALNASGSFASGATLAFYTAGSSTTITTYNAPTAGSANANPVVADAFGRFDEIWIETGQSIKYAFTPYTGATAITVDNVPVNADVSVTITAALNDFLAGTAPLPVANGGTAATTLTGVATSLGLGTGDSPQFAGINVGHASDTTIARASAGNLTVEGNAIYRAGGTDVALADGGTGASTAAAAIAALTGLALPVAGTFAANTVSLPVIMPNGSTFLIQGGTGSLAAATTGTITFPIAYSTEPVCIVNGGSSNTTHQGDVHISGNPSTTAVAICSSNGLATCTYNWVSIGKVT